MLITPNSALFLDRDGVLNTELPNDYVKTWAEFKFYDTTLEALAILTKIFNKIFIVTNQKGIAKQLMTHYDLTSIHTHMLTHIQLAGGRIDGIYYAPAMSQKDYSRKPNTGMALQAKIAHPTIQLNQSYMVGNNMSDMHFGYNAGMHTIFLSTTNAPVIMPHMLIQYQYPNLLSMAQYMQALG